MQIFIIHEGKQSGPFSEGDVRTLLSKGHVNLTDLSWRKGLEGWLPLNKVLDAATDPSGAQPPLLPSSATAEKNASTSTEAAITPKQIAFLKYLSAEIGPDATKETAALAISDALEKPKLQDRIRKWHDEKLRLHPDLYQDEIDVRRATRVNRYLELCHTEGADVVKDVTKAHVQVLVESLDRRFPRWESDPPAALWDYLLPAIAEHFQQLVHPEWKGRLTLGGTSKVAAAATGRKPGGQSAKEQPDSPNRSIGLSAIGKGIVLGGIALAVIAGGIFACNRSKRGASKPETQASKPEQSAPPPAVPPAQAPDQPPKPEIPDIPPVKPPAPIPEIPPIQALPPAAPVENPPAPPQPAPPAPLPVAPVPPAPAPADPAPAPPIPLPPAPPPPVNEVNLPGLIDNPQSPAPPISIPATPATPATPAPAVPRATVVLTQAIGVDLPNGQIKLPAGTQLRVLAADGANLRVAWNNQVFAVPAIATDFAKGATPAPPATPAIPPNPPQPRTAPEQLAPPPLDPKPAPKPGDDL